MWGHHLHGSLGRRLCAEGRGDVPFQPFYLFSQYLWKEMRAGGGGDGHDTWGQGWVRRTGRQTISHGSTCEGGWLALPNRTMYPPARTLLSPHLLLRRFWIGSAAMGLLSCALPHPLAWLSAWMQPDMPEQTATFTKSHWKVSGLIPARNGAFSAKGTTRC